YIACGDFFVSKKSPRAHVAAPPLRKRSRSAHLFAYKRALDGSLSLPTFCGLRFAYFIQTDSFRLFLFGFGWTNSGFLNPKRGRMTVAEGNFDHPVNG
ncbi:MAG: hypothetical protein IJM20_00740, partial [Clostridia bacterium]|nr:hypothetical protein [Clostridia bacterium]